jgi:integrase
MPRLNVATSRRFAVPVHSADMGIDADPIHTPDCPPARRHSHVAAGVSIKRDKRKERKLEVGRDIPEPKEVKRLIETATATRDRALLLTVSLTGLRASELRGLRWSDVDLKAAELYVRQRADRYNVMGPPKTESSVRAMPMPPEALFALKRWKLECPANDGNLVFPTSTGHVEHHSNMLRSLAPVMVAAGLVDGEGEPKYALHAFRHFFANWCLNSRSRGGRQLPLKEVQRGSKLAWPHVDRYDRGYLWAFAPDQ